MRSLAAFAREYQRDRDECPKEALLAQQDRAQTRAALVTQRERNPQSSHAVRKETSAAPARGSDAALRIDETAPPPRVQPGPPAPTARKRSGARRDVDQWKDRQPRATRSRPHRHANAFARRRSAQRHLSRDTCTTTGNR